jgi:glucosamine--fructose-6-phosphate aminotransferase (isomerizing)
MCGIFGIISRNDIVSNLLSGLERLEYRGYDSSGIAVIGDGDVQVRKAQGKLETLRALVTEEPISGTTGIGHTRWATHGAPSTRNAHPHRAGIVTIVHNGIIENHAELRSRLEAAGCVFNSDTDTEVIAHLLNTEIQSGPSPLQALLRTIKVIKGAYSIAILMDTEPDLVFVAKSGSPLAIGYTEEEQDGSRDIYIGSDATVLSPFAQTLCYLEDGDVGILSRKGVLIFDTFGRDVTRPLTEVSEQPGSVERGPYAHYMLKEIHEQPEVLKRLLATWNGPHSDHPFTRIADAVDLTSIDRIILIACGTSHYASMVAKYWLETWAHVVVETDIASEYRYRSPAFTGRELAIFISQSGETADTLAALRHTLGKVAARVAIVNVTTSSIAREANAVLDINAGPEIGVASTKAFTAQLFTLAAFSLALGKARGTVSDEWHERMMQKMLSLPRLMSETLRLDQEIANHSRTLAQRDGAFFIGRGTAYPMALEGALKLKEISYIKAEGYAAGELKHGPISLVEPGYPVVVLAPHDSLCDKTLSNSAEVEARGGHTLLIVDAELQARNKLVLPEAEAFLFPFTSSCALQLLAYHAAIERGSDVDKPRNLAKSVTVE